MGDSGPLVGRDREVAALTAFLRESGPGGLLISGEAGVGKSALWEYAAGAAADAGALVLTAQPAEGEERRSYSVLLDLLRDLDLADVPMSDRVRRALETVLLRSPSDEAVEPHVVAVGTHAALTHLAADRRVAVFIDDVQWADAASIDAVTSAARRLGDLPVQFVLARRAGFGRSALEAFLARRDLRHVEPRLLTVAETARLLAQRLSLTLNQRTVRLVHEQSRGNPLFALEVGRVLGERGVPERGEPLGLPDEMAAMFGLRVRGLDRDLRTLLLAVSLDPQVTEPTLIALFGADLLERALDAGLVEVGRHGDVRAWHPLLSAAAGAAATPGQRRDLHARLAKVVESDEARLRHEALASAEPEELLAERLADAAADAGARGAAETALELAELALARTPPSSGARVARVLDLAGRLAVVNESQRLTELLEPEVERMPHGTERGQALLMLLNGVWKDVAHAQHLVDRALAECGGDPLVRGRALEARSFIAGGISVADARECLAWAEEAIALGAHEEHEWRMVGRARSWCLVRGGRPPEPAEGEPMWKRLIWRGELAAAEQAVRDRMASAEEAGRFQEAESYWERLFDVLERSGRVREARQYLDTLLDVDLSPHEATAVDVMRAVVAARYGDPAAVRELATPARERAAHFGDVWNRLEADHVLAVADLQSGEPEAAEARLRGVLDHIVTVGMLEPGAFPVAPDLVEALALHKRFDEAREVTAWLEQLAADQEHPWGLAMTERSRVLVGLLDGAVPPQDGSSRIGTVADALVTLGLRHDAARAHLVVGSALRRQRQWGLARDHLEAARSRFAELGADGWATTVEGELSRVGGRRRGAEGALTPTELEVARLAGAGLPNKAIARRLHVSISTVEGHLTRVYAKLGVRSRAELGGQLGGGSAGVPPA